MPIQITVLPKNGEGFYVSPIENQQDVDNLVVKDGDTVLVPGRDYIVSEVQQGDTVNVIIQFIGNYTGTIRRSFSTGTPSDINQAPQTGDSSFWSIMIYLVAAICSATGLAVLYMRYNKRRKQSR